jgi:hypothetical protein
MRYTTIFLGVVLCFLFAYWMPHYWVYSARLEGQAIKAKAEGEAEANRILAESIEKHPDLMNYLFVRELGQRRGTIYVPTEANLPILEATRKGQPSRGSATGTR